MKILFVTAHPFLPQLFGGLQTSTDQLCRALMNKNYEVVVLTGLTSGDYFSWGCRIKLKINKIFFGSKVSRDKTLGYPVWRTWFPWESVEYVASQEKPDLIIVLAGEPVRMGYASKLTGIPVLMKLQNVEFDLHGMPFENLGNISCVANSQFTAEKYRKAYGVDSSVIFPFINLAKYRTETTKENVTFINPIPEKGRDIAVAIARRCPDIPFSFIEAWPLSSIQRSELNQQLSSLPNVDLQPPQKEMRTVYGKCKILLVPSVWEEAYGRVVTEAQISGIPVVASARGGLPEAVGPGGILLNPDGSIDDWVNAIRKLWFDKDFYDEMSAKALIYATRDELTMTYHVELWEKTINDAVSQHCAVKTKL